MYRVKDVMTRQVVCVSPEASIDEAISLLLENRVSGLPIAGEDGVLLGVISEVDIIDLVYRADIANASVGDYMTREVQTLDPEASLDDAAARFCSSPNRRIPVTLDGRLVGVISRHDMIRFLRDVRRSTSEPTSTSEPASANP